MSILFIPFLEQLLWKSWIKVSYAFRCVSCIGHDGCNVSVVFGVVSFSEGNSALPFGHRLIWNIQCGGKGFLCEIGFFAQVPDFFVDGHGGFSFLFVLCDRNTMIHDFRKTRNNRFGASDAPDSWTCRTEKENGCRTTTRLASVFINFIGICSVSRFLQIMRSAFYISIAAQIRLTVRMRS